ncbi:MAG: tryptophan synthase subunit alpha [Chloroflexota bacterium]|nr:tryptophan synthase subunit alpha [Chloroflexota bacterium]MDE2940768.1 tryptophan synthase subunit alpha [Chloroflexota bacterium]MDE3266950.1 tryptophan synthase subunit alpha [Chloroflexota bacterium]
MDRIKDRFDALAARGDMGLIPYLTVGFPTVEDTLSLIPALEEGGADVIELGVPFSDPIADGPTIQRSSFHALTQGVTPAACLDVCGRLRGAGVSVPFVLMGYYNSILSYGLERFAGDAAQAGVDGAIVVDLPFEEAGPLRNAFDPLGIHIIPLLTPTSTDTRIEMNCEGAGGFVYCVSLTGVTGARDELPPGIPDMTRRVRCHTELPLAVGFGVSQRRHVEALSSCAQAAVVGSALVDLVDRTPGERRAEEAKEFVAGLKGAVPTQGRR